MLLGDTCLLLWRLLDLEVLALLLPLLVAALDCALVAVGRFLSAALAVLVLAAGAGVLVTLVFAVLVAADFCLTLVVLVLAAAVLVLLFAVAAGAFLALDRCQK